MKTQRVWNPFTIEQWIAWLGSTVIAAISLMVFFYQNFETKAEALQHKDTQDRSYLTLEKRLDRIEDKLDQLLHRLLKAQ